MGDTDDRYALDRARNYAGWVSYDARNLLNDVGSLSLWAGKIKIQRNFLTEFEAQLDEAEKALNNAIERIQTARKRYKALPRA